MKRKPNVVRDSPLSVPNILARASLTDSPKDSPEINEYDIANIIRKKMNRKKVIAKFLTSSASTMALDIKIKNPPKYLFVIDFFEGICGSWDSNPGRH